MNYEALRARIQEERPDIALKAVDEAYAFAKKAHGDQKRYSGELYIVHPVAATYILLDLNPDLASIQACLLHDVTEDTETELEAIEKNFGIDVAELVKGCEKMAIVKMKKDDAKRDKWQHLFLAMAKDIRIVFIKLADRLHNMRTLEFVPVEKRKRIAQESLQVHAAIASRLGIYQIKSELEDLCFQYLFPEEYASLMGRLKENREIQKHYIDHAVQELEALLLKEEIHFMKIQGRFKHLWSIHEKLKGKGEEALSEVYDLFALRIVLPDLYEEGVEQVSHLYKVLGLLHKHFLPLQDRFKDYVSLPKPNGYRSLHTTVLGLGGEVYEQPTEIQIRTETMHLESEIGVASHTDYKAGFFSPGHVDPKRHLALHKALEKLRALVKAFPEIEGPVETWVEHFQEMHPDDRGRVERTLREKGLSDEDLTDIRHGRSQEHFTLRPTVERQLAWLRGLGESEQTLGDLDLFPDKIFVLTPSKEVLELTKEATPVDFAYAVHTELGHKMTHAKVNGRVVPLDYTLSNGDLVEVVTRRDAKPSRYWVSIAKSASARTKIKSWFNRQDKERHLAEGREAINRVLQNFKLPILDEKLSLLKEYGGMKRDQQEREQILEAVALGSVSPHHVVRQSYPELYESKAEDKSKETPPKNSVSEPSENYSNRVLITGEKDLPVILSACCKPRPPMPIIGYVTRGRSIRVHQHRCSELSGLDAQRFVSAHWLKN